MSFETNRDGNCDQTDGQSQVHQPQAILGDGIGCSQLDADQQQIHRGQQKRKRDKQEYSIEAP